jgi:hypothetical protein
MFLLVVVICFSQTLQCTSALSHVFRRLQPAAAENTFPSRPIPGYLSRHYGVFAFVTKSTRRCNPSKLPPQTVVTYSP